MGARATRRYRRLKLVGIVGLAVALLVTGGATAEPSFPPTALNLTEPLGWANPAARAPGGAGVPTNVTRIPLGAFDKPAAGVTVHGGTPGGVPLADGLHHSRKARSLTTGRTSTGPFSAVGFTWRETGDVGSVSASVRHHVPGGDWGAWQSVGVDESDRDPEPGPVSSGYRQRGGADLIWTGPSDGVQLAVVVLSGVAPHDITADLIDPTDAPGDSAPMLTTGTGTGIASIGARPAMPPINRRAAWGADEQQTHWRPQYAPLVKAVAVHHTATSNNYPAQDVPKLLRSIYEYQTVGRGWGDIGYNVVADRFGRLWEGRSGGLARPVVGAQAGGFNTGTAGIALLGDYRTTAVPSVTVDAAAQYIAWKLSLSQNLDPRDTVTLIGGGSMSRYQVGTTLNVPRIFPHRQTSPTECPGARGMDVLPVLRTRAAAILGDLVKTGTVRARLGAWRAADGTLRLPGSATPVFTSGPGEIPVPADYDGDGIVDMASWSPTTGNWNLQLSGTGDGRQQRIEQWGLPGDMPAPADFDGDGVADLAVFRPATGTWYIKGLPEVVYGANGDVPEPGDYNGAGRAEPALWRPSTGMWMIHGVREAKLGESFHIPLPGDYNGDGAIEPAAWSPTTQRFFVWGQQPTKFGAPGDIPIPGQYNGDGKMDLAVFHANPDGTATFDIRGVGSYDVGAAGDVPMPLG